MALQLKNRNTNSKVNTLKVSKYENPQATLNLIAQICSVKEKKNKVSMDKIDYITYGDDKFDGILGYFYQNRRYFYDIDAFSDLQHSLQNLRFFLEQNEIKDYTKVIVAGGFSSGKSTMINKLTKIGNLLPTGTEPVSVIPIYIYCTSKENTLRVQGENLKYS